jgi:cupin superfamily acireductone dioxygenase involved in methionine salvage
VVREFARVDSSIAHVFGFHHLMLATVRLFSRPDQWQPGSNRPPANSGSGAMP